MFADPNNPFAAAAPKNGSAPSPFESAPKEARPSNSSASPAEPASDKDRPARPSQDSTGSPFALAHKIPEPRIAEPSEGFAAVDKEPARQIPAPLSIPQIRAQRGPGDDDSFADPSQQKSQQGFSSDLVLPAERSVSAGVPAPRGGPGVQAAPSAGSARPDPPSRSAPAVHGNMPQLVLRAIFGVTRELDKKEILERARTLPGVLKLHLVSPDEATAMSFIRSSVQRMGFGDQHSMSLHTDAGTIDFVEEPGATLAVLHEGEYEAGVRETLFIVARELGRLD